MKILVAHPGMLTTVQDLGRPGHGVDGVSRAGAADAVALRVGNRLLGNDDGAAALEMTLVGGTFTFPGGGEVVLTGARAAGWPGYRPMRIPAGGFFRVGPFEEGARAYLCVRGGIEAPLVGGSASTHVASGLGGRVLRKGDVLTTGEARGEVRAKEVPAALTGYRTLLRVTRGPQATQLDEGTFYGHEYRVTTQANRMGIRLRGRAIGGEQTGQMVTEGAPLGAIQAPADGQPIILFVDQQTTGGYPKIANVITADLGSVGQLRPGDKVRFRLVSAAEARELLLEQEGLVCGI
jgi:biotin-dependent carboxylase-like uncharacterized protein